MDSITEGQVSEKPHRSVDAVEAVLNYIAESSEKPVYYAYEPPAGTPKVSGTFVPHAAPIRNARAVVGELSLDRQGFELTRQQTAVRDFCDREEVERVLL